MPGWDRFDVPGYVQRTFDVPVLVDNDVNILALGEQATSWPRVDDLVFVKVSTGIGAGIIAGGQLQRGAQGSAGDMGHVQVPMSAGSARQPGDETLPQLRRPALRIDRRGRPARREGRRGALHRRQLSSPHRVVRVVS